MRLNGVAEAVQKIAGFEREDQGRLLSGILRNSGSVVITRGLIGLLKIVALLYVARYLGSSEFGRLSLVLALLELFRVLSDFGVETVMIRSLAREEPAAEREILTSSIALKCALACAAYLGVVLVSGWAYRTQEIGTLTAVASLSLFPWALSSGLSASFQAKLRMHEIVPAHLVGGAVYVAGLLGGAALRWPLGFLVAVLPLSDLTTLTLCAVLYRRNAVAVAPLSPSRLYVRPRTIMAILSSAWPLGLTSLLVIAYFRLDTLLVGWLIGKAAIGQYAVAYRITEPFLLLPHAVSVSVYSAVSTLWDKKRDEAMHLYLTSIITAALYASCVAVSLTLFAPAILVLISPSYLEAASALRVLAWSLVFMSCNLISTALINAMGRHRFLMVGSGATLLANLSLNLLLIPRFGIVGAGVATVATEAVNFLIQTTYVYTQRHSAVEGSLRT